MTELIALGVIVVLLASLAAMAGEHGQRALNHDELED